MNNTHISPLYILVKNHIFNKNSFDLAELFVVSAAVTVMIENCCLLSYSTEGKPFLRAVFSLLKEMDGVHDKPKLKLILRLIDQKLLCCFGAEGSPEFLERIQKLPPSILELISKLRGGKDEEPGGGRGDEEPGGGKGDEEPGGGK